MSFTSLPALECSYDLITGCDQVFQRSLQAGFNVRGLNEG